MNTRRILLSNGGWSLASQIVRVGALGVVTIALSRHFGPQAFGALAVGLAFVRIFAVVAAFGLDRVLVRHLALARHDAAAILRTAFWLKLLIAILSYGSLLGLVCWVDPHNRLLLMIALLAGSGLLFQPCEIFDYYFQSRNQFRLAFLGRTVPFIVATALKLVAIAIGAPLLAFAWLEAAEMALIGTALFVVYRRSTDWRSETARRVLIDPRPLVWEAFPLLLGSLAAMIYMRSDVLILGKLSGYRVAGVYSAAAQITEGCALLPMALMPALLPLLIQWRRAGCAFYRSQCEKIFLGAFVSGLAISFFLATTAPFLIRLAYGAAYSSAAPILVIQAWSAVFLFLSIAQTGYEVTEKLTWLSAARTIAGATLNVLLNFALVPRYGAIGSAVATLVSLGSSACLVNLLIPAGRPIARMQLGALRQIRALREIFRPTFRFPAPQLVNPGSVAR